jgi:hypothetical protein
MNTIFRLLSGIVLLIFGRNLFWLLVAAVGFLAGVSLAPRILPQESEGVILIVAIVVGLVGALLALLVPNVIGMITGFVAGGYLALTLVEVLDLNLGDLAWLPFLIGGVIGAIIVLMLFDWALIVLSSLAGATTIISLTSLHGGLALLAVVVLFIIGVAVQSGLWSRRRRTVETISR